MDAPTLNPAALSPELVAKLLSQAGGKKISAAAIEAYVAAGAPTNADGTIHLIHYTAWLASQVK